MMERYVHGICNKILKKRVFKIKFKNYDDAEQMWTPSYTACEKLIMHDDLCAFELSDGSSEIQIGKVISTTHGTIYVDVIAPKQNHFIWIMKKQIRCIFIPL